MQHGDTSSDSIIALPASVSDYMSVQDVAKLLGVSRATVYRYVADGMPSHSPGGPKGRRLFDPLEVQEWVKSRCSQPSPDESTDRVDGDAA